MQLNIYIFYVKCVIIYNLSYFNTVKALIGENVIEADENLFSFIASIAEIENERQHYCTGTIISKRHVISAAHCVESMQVHEVVIHIGSVDFTYSRNYYPLFWLTYDSWAMVRQIEANHPINDIAILKLSTNVPDYIIPPPLSTLTNYRLYGLNVTTAGWGLRDSGEIHNSLEAAYVNVMTHRACENKIKNYAGQRIPVGKNILCTLANPYAVLCKGDSGGPLLYNGQLIGVNKGTCLYTEVDFHPDKINLHMSITSYIDFILDIIDNW